MSLPEAGFRRRDVHFEPSRDMKQETNRHVVLNQVFMKFDARRLWLLCQFNVSLLRIEFPPCKIALLLLHMMYASDNICIVTVTQTYA